MKEEKKGNHPNVESSQNPLRSKTKKIVEISDEAKEERRLLEAFLLHKKEELVREQNKRKKQIEEEKIELRNGKTISRLEIKEYVTSIKRPYSALFPNRNPFFKNLFRLHPSLTGLDPNKFTKPRLAGRLLKKLIYRRFDVDVLPALLVLAMPDGIRLFKCHEYLTPKGVTKVKRFRNQANNQMKEYKDLAWYEFEKEFSKKHKLVFQPRLEI